MKIYISYLVTSLTTIYVLLFYLGFSASFANYLPISALVGSTLLLIVGIPVSLYYKRLGLIISLLFLILTAPYFSTFGAHIIKAIFSSTTAFSFIFLIILLPPLMILISIYLTIKSLVKRNRNYLVENRSLKIILTVLPILLFVLYIIIYGKHWSMEFFNI